MGVFFGVLVGAPTTVLLAFIGLAIDGWRAGDAEKQKTEQGKEQQVAGLHKAIQPHLHTLSRKRRQLCLIDDYGNVDDARWRKEVAYFFNSSIKILDGDRMHIDSSDIFNIIDRAARDTVQENPDVFDETMSPYDYEHYCARLIENAGWQTSVTKGSGDQGIDVIATKNGFTMVVQCKMYSTPVGNKAVQEASAGKGFIQADAAIVVTNNSYTPSARQLAATLEVKLLHHEELWKINEIFQSHTEVNRPLFS